MGGFFLVFINKWKIMLKNVLDVVREWIIVLDSEFFMLLVECWIFINEVVEIKIKYYIFVCD